MAIIRPYTARDEQSLMTEMWDPQISEDLEKFVMFAFPWGKANTPLENFKGPRNWQREELQKITQHIKDNKFRMDMGLLPTMDQAATSSGRGPGKSVMLSWMALWMMSTRMGSTTILAANSEEQLKSRTLAELGKWHTLLINSHWFEPSAMTIRPHQWFEKAIKDQLKIDTKYYYIQGQLWTEEKPDNFAGAHNQYGMFVGFDEASGIPKSIWGVTKGFFTDPVLHRYWHCYSNPRRNTGSFFECFHRDRDFWRTRNIDSRTVEGTDLAVYESIIKQHGEDSDEARIEVYGQFPKQGDKQFISRGIIEDAQNREIEIDVWAPLMMGVDPARFGDDKTVIRFRQGRNAKVIPPVRLKGADNMQVANECAFLIQKYNPDAVCIDAGNGTGIIDRLREMGYRVHEVWFGKASPEPEWANFRTYLWAQMRDWLGGGCIDKDPFLMDDLSAPEYKFMGTSDKLRLETKEELKARGFASPDDGDALACTFAVKVASRDLKTSRKGNGRGRQAQDVDYKLFS